MVGPKRIFKTNSGKRYFLDCFLEIVFRNKRNILLKVEKKYRVCNLSYSATAGENCAWELLMRVLYHNEVYN